MGDRSNDAIARRRERPTVAKVKRLERERDEAFQSVTNLQTLVRDLRQAKGKAMAWMWFLGAFAGAIAASVVFMVTGMLHG